MHIYTRNQYIYIYVYVYIFARAWGGPSKLDDLCTQAKPTKQASKMSVLLVSPCLNSRSWVPPDCRGPSVQAVRGL